MGIEPTPSAWKAEVLPLNYTRLFHHNRLQPTPFRHHHARICAQTTMVEGAGFEPAKAEPSDLQSDPVDRLGTPPKKG